MNYIVANPSGNITVLVTQNVPAAERLDVVRDMFEKEPTCEQVGFVKVLGEDRISLEMMGGEFCGNATMSTAAYLADINGGEGKIVVEASGADEPVEVQIVRKGVKEYTGTLEMPMPTIDGNVVKLDGISHMIVPASETSREEMEAVIKGIADEQDVLAFGMIRYDEDDCSIEPLVYVKGSDTLVWENGCASGSIATAYYRYVKQGIAESAVKNPGGVLNVKFDGGRLFITGTVIL
ncbi:MAG: hypothetical protein KBS56_03005 [Clostridiales bacterium]|nr:hypothetical protein [Candidatus Crickella equi]